MSGPHNPKQREPRASIAKETTADRTATMTLNMPPRSMAALDAMAAEEGMSKTATVRAALRLYQLLKVRMRKTGATEIMLRGQDGEVVRLVPVNFLSVPEAGARAED